MDILQADFMERFKRLTADAFQKGWHERNGGNLTYRVKPEEVEAVRDSLHAPETWAPIGNTVPGLKGEYFLVTGSGNYMRNVALAPEENTALIKIDDKGENYSIVWGLTKGGRPTSELPTHLAAHELKKQMTDGRNRIIYHAHPTNLIALTFVLPLEDKAFTRELWEMATEDPVIFPEGIGVVPWMVPGGKEIADASVAHEEVPRRRLGTSRALRLRR
jgi:rhamnulose-1-phosphate aldolase